MYRLSGGVPRRINILCENALLTGYAENYKLIFEKVIRKVGAYNQNEESPAEVIEKRSNTTEANNIAVQSKPASVGIKTPAVDTPRPGSNGAFDYRKFQKYLDQFLNENKLSINRRSSPGHIIFGVVFGFVMLVLSFITAIYIAMQMGIIN